MRKAATKRATEKRKLKRRMARFAAIPYSELYPFAQGYYDISRSPRVMTKDGRPIKRGEQVKKRTKQTFLRLLKIDPEFAAAFLSGMYSFR